MKLEGQIFCVEEHEVSDIIEFRLDGYYWLIPSDPIVRVERCAACVRAGCDEGYDYFDTEDSDGNPLRLCVCCDQLWPSGERNPED